MNRRSMLRFCLAVAASRAAVHGAFAATAVRQTRQVSGFDRVVLRGVGTLAIVQGARDALTVVAEQRWLAQISTRVEGGTLFIEVTGNLSTEVPLRYELTARELRAVSAEGSTEVTIAALKAPVLEIELTGSSSLRVGHLVVDRLAVRASDSAGAELAGEASSQTVTVSGSASYVAPKLESAAARVDASDAASASLLARSSLDANLRDSAQITYFGNPKVRKSVSDAASLERG